MKTKIYPTKNKITSLAIAFASVMLPSLASAQYTETFESFTLAPNSAYSSTLNAPFVTSQASFEHEMSGSYWTGGFAYTNVHDSITSGFGNLYGVRAYKGRNASDIYVVGQDKGVVKMAVPQSTLDGFYITNTTYAYKSMVSGDSFAKKFGDTTGTGSGTTIPQGSYPDFFKVIVKGYSNGVLKNDSVTVMLADFTFTNNAQDFILNTWQFVNTSTMGAVDSIKFVMRSSDVGIYGMNTPAFFAIDDFMTTVSNPSGIASVKTELSSLVYPNPFNDLLSIRTSAADLQITVSDITGKTVFETTAVKETVLDLSFLSQGVYILHLDSKEGTSVKRIIKN